MCGGKTIPLLLEWSNNGMSMVTGPATKITNLGALKIVLGIKNFIIYLIFCNAICNDVWYANRFSTE